MEYNICIHIYIAHVCMHTHIHITHHDIVNFGDSEGAWGYFDFSLILSFPPWSTRMPLIPWNWKHPGITVSTEIATSPKSTKSKNSDFLGTGMPLIAWNDMCAHVHIQYQLHDVDAESNANIPSRIYKVVTYRRLPKKIRSLLQKMSLKHARAAPQNNADLFPKISHKRPSTLWFTFDTICALSMKAYGHFKLYMCYDIHNLGNPS